MKDDISKRGTTESRRDRTFEGLRLKSIAECIARLDEKAPQTLKGQITATGSYRYRLEGIVLASGRIKTVGNLPRNLSIDVIDYDTKP